MAILVFLSQSVVALARLTANGPAIKVVSVPANCGVARFLPSSCKFFEFYACRAAPRASEASDGGTMLFVSRSPVPLHRFG